MVATAATTAGARTSSPSGGPSARNNRSNTAEAQSTRQIVVHATQGNSNEPASRPRRRQNPIPISTLGTTPSIRPHRCMSSPRIRPSALEDVGPWVSVKGTNSAAMASPPISTIVPADRGVRVVAGIGGLTSGGVLLVMATGCQGGIRRIRRGPTRPTQDNLGGASMPWRRSEVSRLDKFRRPARVACCRGRVRPGRRVVVPRRAGGSTADRARHRGHLPDRAAAPMTGFEFDGLGLKGERAASRPPTVGDGSPSVTTRKSTVVHTHERSGATSSAYG